MKKLELSKREDVIGNGEKLAVEDIHLQFKFLQGKVLTIIEAAILDSGQLKAIKDLVKTAFSNQMMWVEQLCYPKIRMMTRDEAESTLKNLPE